MKKPAKPNRRSCRPPNYSVDVDAAGNAFVDVLSRHMDKLIESPRISDVIEKRPTMAFDDWWPEFERAWCEGIDRVKRDAWREWKRVTLRQFAPQRTRSKTEKPKE